MVGPGEKTTLQRPGPEGGDSERPEMVYLPVVFPGDIKRWGRLGKNTAGQETQAYRTDQHDKAKRFRGVWGQ